jgi:ribosome-associated heat shock protein Hsp15
MSDNTENSSGTVRLDKWLWFARFYKTRGLAMEAIKAGKVKLAGNRVKPAKTVRPGEVYTLRIDPYSWTVTVVATGTRRGPAAEAALLYAESAESREARALLSEQLKINNQLLPQTEGRPTKRDRRQIVRFTRQTD